MSHKENHNRAIAAQVLCNLAKSAPQGRLLTDFDALFAITRDERFVTARHCLQALWKVGAAGRPQQERLVDALAGRFVECSTEKNCTRIPDDIIQVLRRLYDAVKDDQVIRTEVPPALIALYTVLSFVLQGGSITRRVLTQNLYSPRVSRC